MQQTSQHLLLNIHRMNMKHQIHLVFILINVFFQILLIKYQVMAVCKGLEQLRKHMAYCAVMFHLTFTTNCDVKMQIVSATMIDSHLNVLRRPETTTRSSRSPSTCRRSARNWTGATRSTTSLPSSLSTTSCSCSRTVLRSTT